MISSLSSGMTNIIKDILKISVVIFSYSWLVENISIYKVEELWVIVLFALIVQDFTGYWLHRLNHRVNIFWNRHVIHHSSEEFNLSCALRQSISQTFNYAAILMIPAALLGIPAYIFAILGPIHLFMQFWYHTRLIDKMGILEHVLVTPSHHRVHHAINPEYIDKNYSQIFIVWDKLFGTFQKELPEVKPVYGTLTPASTWNPIIINFKHLWQLLKDSWNTKNLIDKLRIWFMPTGWRPDDVKLKYPIEKIIDPFKQKKYSPHNSIKFVIFSWVEYFFTSAMMFHLFILFNNQTMNLNYLYGAYIFVYIFIYSSILDNKKSFKIYGLVKLFLFLSLLLYQNSSWFGLNVTMTTLIGFYILISSLLPIFLRNK
tara:strand:- start:1589 stop:2704 length:1116 start_codon:yes stop_codon:yes gene_type:complete